MTQMYYVFIYFCPIYSNYYYRSGIGVRPVQDPLYDVVRNDVVYGTMTGSSLGPLKLRVASPEGGFSNERHF